MRRADKGCKGIQERGKYMKKFEIIPLALKKIGRRKVPQQWIEETVNRPDQTVDGYGGRKVRQKKYIVDGKEMLLRVVYEEKEKLIVVTAYLTSKIKRYWR